MAQALQKTAVGELIERRSIAFRAVISPIPMAIRVPGQNDECVRLSLDVYPQDEDQLPALMDLRGAELFIVLTEE